MKGRVRLEATLGGKRTTAGPAATAIRTCPSTKFNRSPDKNRRYSWVAKLIFCLNAVSTLMSESDRTWKQLTPTLSRLRNASTSLHCPFFVLSVTVIQRHTTSFDANSFWLNRLQGVIAKFVRNCQTVCSCCGHGRRSCFLISLSIVFRFCPSWQLRNPPTSRPPFLCSLIHHFSASDDRLRRQRLLVGNWQRPSRP